MWLVNQSKSFEIVIGPACAGYDSLECTDWYGGSERVDSDDDFLLAPTVGGMGAGLMRPGETVSLQGRN